MAEKGFGVKEVNLIGASGTPTITSPNNLNLNAVNVAISTNASVGGTLTVTGNVSVGGTLTYEDVTNIDSVGIITARKNIQVGGTNDIVGTPYSYFYGRGNGGDGVSVYAAEPTLELVGTNGGSHAASMLFRTAANDGIGFNYNPGGNILELKSFDATGNNFQIHASGSNVSNLKTMLTAASGGAVALYHNNTKTFQTTSFGAETIFSSASGATSIFKVLHGNLSQGVGIGYHSIHATGSNTDVQLKLMSKGSSDLSIQTSASENMAIFRPNESAYLYFNNSQKFKTTNTGVTVTGTITADGLNIIDNVSISGVSTATGGSVFGLIQAGVGALNATIQKTDNGTLHLQYNKPGNLELCQGGGQVKVNNNFRVVGLSTMTGGAKLGNLSVGYDSLNVTIQPVSGQNTLHFNYNNGTEVRIGEGQTRSDLIVKGDIEPKTDSAFDLGTTSVRWRNVYADTLYGSGANLTNLPAPTPATTDIQVVYEVTASGSSAYLFSGNGVSGSNNEDLYLIRGKKYRFINNSGGSHPFEIRSSSGGSAYNTGVTNNGAASGNIDFAPSYDSPSHLYYQCTSHGGMVGNIYITGGQYHTRSNNLCLQYTRNSSNVTTGTVIYDLEVFDVGDSNAYNTSNGEFTAPVTGIYRIQFEHFAAGTGRATANIEKNSGGGWSVIKIGMRVYASSATGANWPSVPTIYFAQLNANDKIRITHREGTIHLNNPWNHLTVQLVQ